MLPRDVRGSPLAKKGVSATPSLAYSNPAAGNGSGNDVTNITNFAPINIHSTNQGGSFVIAGGGGASGGININQTAQNTTNQSWQTQNSYQTTENISNIFNTVNNLLSGSGSIGSQTQSGTASPFTGLYPSQGATQSASPSNATDQTAGGGGTDYVTLAIIAVLGIGALYFLTKKKK